ncbi:MAG: hypothetical protein V3S41_08405, partial [Spirochaetia bacterium]
VNARTGLQINSYVPPSKRGPCSGHGEPLRRELLSSENLCERAMQGYAAPRILAGDTSGEPQIEGFQDRFHKPILIADFATNPNDDIPHYPLRPGAIIG